MLRASQSTFSRAVLFMADIPVRYQLRNHGFPNDDIEGNINSQHRNPIRLLRNSQATLNELTASWCIIACPLGDLYAPRYPHLSTLNLLNDEFPPQTHHYARAFPNLKILLVKTIPKDLDMFSGIQHAFDIHRARNEALQLHHGTWNALESLTISGSGTSRIDVPMFHAILQPIQPAYIHLESLDVSALYTGSFGGAMSGPSVAALRSLDVSLALSLYVSPAKIHIPRALDTLADSLAGLSLHTFGLNICCTGLQFPLFNGIGLDVKNTASFFARGALWPAEEQLVALDLDALARRTQAAAPSLRTVVLSIAGHRVRPNTVVVGGEDAALALGEHAVEAIPLRLAMELQKSWSAGAEYLEKVTKVTARFMSEGLGSGVEGDIAEV